MEAVQNIGYNTQEKIAQAFVKQQMENTLNIAPENTYFLADYKILSIRVTESEEMRFVFQLVLAVNPRELNNFPWIAGNGYYGENDLSEYIIKSTLYRLDLLGEWWTCTDAGTGDVRLDS